MKIPILSFFCGGGLLDLAFGQSSFEVCWRNEVSPAFVRAFAYASERHFGASAPIRVNTNSIVEIGPRQILNEAFGAAGRPELFGVIGGPPCPDFSIAGKNKGREGENGRLTEVYTNRVIELNPTFFLLENVGGLARTRAHSTYLHQLIERLSFRYVVDWRILNALDYGCPQDRQRLVLIGVARSYVRRNPVDSSFTWPVDARYAGAKARYCWPTVCEKGDTPIIPAGVPPELMVGSALDPATLEGVPNMEGLRPKSDRIPLVREGDVSRKSFKRLHRWRYSPTAAYGNNEVHIHPFLDRRITVREAMRIQTIPDTYVLPPKMPLTAKYKMIGNGVPILLGKAVADALAHIFTKKN